MADCVRASWILPMHRPPIRDGWVQVREGRVVAVGDGDAPGTTRDLRDRLGEVALLPGLINAHTHLELSWMAGRVPPAPSMERWISAMMAVRRSGPAGGDAEVLAAADRAIRAAMQTGTVAFGDVTNSLATVSALVAAGASGVVFHEILGFNPIDARGLVHDATTRLRAVCPAEIAAAVVAHAPYSTAPDVFREIARAHDGTAPLSVHLAESADEMELLRSATGPMRALLERLGVWSGQWEAPGAHPVRFLKSLGYLAPGTLLVHAVHFSAADLDEACEAGAVIVTCPRSNTWVGGGVPPLARFYGSGIPVAIGTDSLASVDSLNLFDELAAMRRLAPEVEAGRFLDSATRVGAAALRLNDLGQWAPGCRATGVAVGLPPVTTGRDVEEYLVSGIPSSAITPLTMPSC
jgi:cytosine/adenosine deaminase-related metal-dependent hydrolase